MGSLVQVNSFRMSDRPVRDLTDWLLHVVRHRPAMYMGNDVNERGIWTLQTYIHGYEVRYFIEEGSTKDRYTDRFTDWLYTRKHVAPGPLRLGPIIDECGGDPLLALRCFFEYLELFDHEVPFVD
jgi:hypothetical protein